MIAIAKMPTEDPRPGLQDNNKQTYNLSTKEKMRPTPCLPSDTIVVYMSPVIAGTPPASSSGRGRGTIVSSLLSLDGQVRCVGER
jgi:hypothetical protein